jgi:hypothetical protein
MKAGDLYYKHHLRLTTILKKDLGYQYGISLVLMPPQMKQLFPVVWRNSLPASYRKMDRLKAEK